MTVEDKFYSPFVITKVSRIVVENEEAINLPSLLLIVIVFVSVVIMIVMEIVMSTVMWVD